MADRRRTILIVEDDEHQRRLLSMALRLAGFTALEASDGLQALAILERSQLDAVLLDVMLPGLDGIAVRQEIAAHSSTRNLPVIFVTGSDMSLDHVKSACILRKPVTPDEVVATVERCLRESGA